MNLRLCNPSVRKSLFNNSLILENFLVHSLNNEDGIVRPKFIYEYKVIYLFGEVLISFTEIP